MHERRSAMARALEERGNEYILPIKVDDAELPGLQPTVGHMPVSKGMDDDRPLVLDGSLVMHAAWRVL